MAGRIPRAEAPRTTPGARLGRIPVTPGDCVLSVIVVDDVPALRILLRRVLESTPDFEVVGEAADGVQGVELAGRLKPDVVLLDLSMPIMDGLEALPLIIDSSPGSRVVVLSGFEERRLGPGVLELGAVGYLEKGLPPADLLATLRLLLGL